jgi:CBS-domain-containing membrane protein
MSRHLRGDEGDPGLPGHHAVEKYVAELMARQRISGVPILDDAGRLAGVISEKDFLGRMGAAHVMSIIAVLHATRKLHPPGGATALIAVIGGEKIHNLGFMYALFPVGGGALIMLVIALLVNTLPKQRRSPEFWV